MHQANHGIEYLRMNKTQSIETEGRIFLCHTKNLPVEESVNPGLSACTAQAGLG